jgi:hypothetical protein
MKPFRRSLLGMALLGMLSVAAHADGLDDKGCCRIKGTTGVCSTVTKAECDQIGKNAGEGNCTEFSPTGKCQANGNCSIPYPLQADAADPFAANADADVCTCCPDLTAPTCRLLAKRPGPPAQIDIEVQDSGIGLGSIEVLIAENASVPIPGFAGGTQNPVVITATKLNQKLLSRVELRVLDVSGNATTCDPVLTSVVRTTGKPEGEIYLNLPAEEDTVTIENGTPGLRKLEITMNGQKFQLAGLKDGETQTVDVSSAMLPGTDNTCVLKSSGKPGGSALVLIWGGEQ